MNAFIFAETLPHVGRAAENDRIGRAPSPVRNRLLDDNVTRSHEVRVSCCSSRTCRLESESTVLRQHGFDPRTGFEPVNESGHVFAKLHDRLPCSINSGTRRGSNTHRPPQCPQGSSPSPRRRGRRRLLLMGP
jgi:hypothetical protein